MRQHICIYNGPGTCQESISHVEHMLTSLLSNKYLIKKIDHEDVKNKNWINQTKLFIMPGGADLPYVRYLKLQGNSNIKQFVENGGIYFGICAGAYYASKQVEFAINTPIEVVGGRELAFFNGKAVGPMVPYEYDSKSGARAALLTTEFFNLKDDNDDNLEQKIYSYYNGGCYFEVANYHNNINVLANYEGFFNEINEFNHNKAAIIEIPYGRGKAILSGVHYEYSPQLIQDKTIEKIIKIPLLNNNNNRILFIRKLFKYLGFSLNDMPCCS